MAHVCLLTGDRKNPKTFFLFFTLFSSWHFLCIFVYLQLIFHHPTFQCICLMHCEKKPINSVFCFQIIWPYKCSLPGVNFIRVLQAAFMCADPKRAKKIVKLSVFFALSGSTCIKAVYKMLVKLFIRFNLSRKKYYRLQVFL